MKKGVSKGKTDSIGRLSICIFETGSTEVTGEEMEATKARVRATSCSADTFRSFCLNLAVDAVEIRGDRGPTADSIQVSSGLAVGQQARQTFKPMVSPGEVLDK